ncbi:hypothetical protein [Nocardioides houyundeii]|uniref:hypothetical protein n=1 Tax=Nocardioides houyundeii TaxID=2045452 RepID=UPI000C7885B6|nr:hypothetical protein [Nocardioides houyundeii]
MRHATVLVAVLITVLVAGLAGCGSDPEEGSAPVDTDEQREQVVSRLREISETVAPQGEVSDLYGKWTVCGGPPDAGVEYRASGRLVPSVDPGASVQAAAEALVAQGWTVTEEGSDPQPWANLERDGVTASLRINAYRSDEVTFSVAGDCVELGEGGTKGWDYSRERLDG